MPTLFFCYPSFFRSASSTTRGGRFSHKEKALKIYTDDNQPKKWNQQDTINNGLLSTELGSIC